MKTSVFLGITLISSLCASFAAPVSVSQNNEPLVAQATGMAGYTGIVRSHSDAKGYGFISSASGEHVVFRYADRLYEFTVRDGQGVSYNVTQTKKGPMAINVALY